MIKLENFFDSLRFHGVEFYTGVPDSLLADLCYYIDEKVEDGKHLIAGNEGNAIGLAIGYHLATRKYALVYMQNSGLGNAVNPLLSLADPEVYNIPMLLVVGWRGEPGVKDEPQHLKQGRVTLSQLDLMEIPYWILDANSNVNEILNVVFLTMQKRNSPVALVVRKNTFEKYNARLVNHQKLSFCREAALDKLMQLCSDDDLIISTTGKTSRELYELRLKANKKQSDFLTVGGMGHTSSIALGVAVCQVNRRVVCLDGDGSLIMHMGSMSVIAKSKPKKFIHVLLNNSSHESVGGQPTSANVIDFKKLAYALGYKNYALATDIQTLEKAWLLLSNNDSPVFLEIKIRNGSRNNLGRPPNPQQNKLSFMEKADSGLR